MNDTQIKAILFDFFGVFTPDPELILFEKLGNPEPIHALFREHDLGRLDDLQLQIKLAEIPGLSAEIVSEAFADSALDTSMLNIATALKPQYKTALASNTAHSLLDGYWLQNPVADYFTMLAISEDLQVTKPDAEFFASACAILGVEPSATLLIDDRQENLEGAKVAGLTTILFEGSGPLLDALADAGIDLELT